MGIDTFLSPGVAWLDENPKAGTLAGSTSQTITVDYDSTGLAPGAYLATIKAGQNTPYGSVQIPVTMNVTALPPVITFAKAGGTPFVLTLTGSNFHNPCTIFINGTAVPVTQWKSATLLKGKGSTLKTMLPKGTLVQITVTNDDGISSAPFPYTR
jgi:hypothetical protein